jgi:hypothetical protein
MLSGPKIPLDAGATSDQNDATVSQSIPHTARFSSSRLTADLYNTLSLSSCAGNKMQNLLQNSNQKSRVQNEEQDDHEQRSIKTMG